MNMTGPLYGKVLGDIRAASKSTRTGMAIMTRGVALFAFVLGYGSAIAAGPPLGSKENPVKSDMPPGESEYLMRLRCPGGEEPRFERVGSFGRGPSGSIIDGYDVRCKDGGGMVFMDMYHPGYREMAAVPGFTALKDLPAYAAEGCPPAVPGFAPGSYVFRPLEVRQGPVPLSDIEAPIPAGRAGRAYAEFVIEASGAVERAKVKLLDLSDESLRAAALDYFAGLKFKPAEQHSGCAVPLKVNLEVDFVQGG
jgi:hypothetical protein